MSANVSDMLSQLQDIAKKNLVILKALNDAFYTKSQYVSVDVFDKTFNIPSFISLENRINNLQSNFEALVESPKSGTANFVFDGATKSIQCGGFNICPAPVKLDLPTTFNVEFNDVLKDFLTPKPYIAFGLSTIPNNITNVQVKKVVLFNDTLISNIITDNYAQSGKISYATLLGLLNDYKEDVDYQEYDTIMRLPIRNNIGWGEFHITNLEPSDVTESFTEYYTFNLDTLSYIADGAITKTLQVGDVLLANGEQTRMEIVELVNATNRVKCKVLHNGYANLMKYEDNALLGTLTFNASPDYNLYKHISVPLEENQYVIIFISPIYETLNTKSIWGDGVWLNTYNLTTTIDGEDYYFKDYYDKFVTNIGDGIMNLTTMLGDMLSNYSRQQWETLKTAVPPINLDNITVAQINSHISNSETYKKIKALYKSKQDFKTELESVQSEIDSIKNTLSQVDFTDDNASRKIYEEKLSTLSGRKKELNTNISTIVKEISMNASDTELSIEGAKYHIRGYFDAAEFINNLGVNVQPIAINVKYRYKNATKDTGNALTINSWTFSDWNDMPRQTRIQEPTEYYLTNYGFDYKDKNAADATKFPIDIPISQGETVDVKLQVVYAPGFPFVEFTSDWSNIYNFEFPAEFTKDVTILDIIEENNEDVKSYQFQSLLDSTGISEHVKGTVEDQDITYYHKPEDISSGFYTAERRVIPLKDKLQELDLLVAQIKDEVLMANATAVKVSLVDEFGVTQELIPFSANTFICQDYQNSTPYKKTTTGDSMTSGSNERATRVSIRIENTSDHNVKLFSPEWGSSSVPVAKDEFTTHYRTKGAAIKEQTKKQILYFYKMHPFASTVNIFGGENTVSANIWQNNTLPSNLTEGQGGLFTNISNENIVVNSDSLYYNTLAPKQFIDFPIFTYTYLASGNTFTQTLAFCIKPNAYESSVIYTCDITQNFENNMEDSLKRTASSTGYASTVY